MTAISVAELRAHDICVDQLALFRATFGDGPVAVSEAHMSRAVDVGLQIEWLECLLAAPARAEYEVARDQAQAGYEAVRAPALAEYEAVRAPARAAYEAATAPAWAEYEAVRDQALAAYRRVIVGPLVRALRAEDGAA